MDKREILDSKILNQKSLEYKLAGWKFKNSKIVFTNGCFDIIHRGHVEYLAKAASLGDVLIVGLNSDKSVKRIKGPDRPVQDETARLLILAAMQFVSAVVLFDEDTPYELIKKVQPDVLVKGADYKPEEIVGYDIVRAKGGSIETIEFIEGQSTTGIISKINR